MPLDANANQLRLKHIPCHKNRRDIHIALAIELQMESSLKSNNLAKSKNSDNI
jgi:hypothetical protein